MSLCFGPLAKKKERIEDSDDDIPLFGPDRLGAKTRKKERNEDSDDNIPLFASDGLMEKIRQQEEEQESQQPLAPDAYLNLILKQEVTGLSQMELNAEAVDEAEVDLTLLHQWLALLRKMILKYPVRSTMKTRMMLPERRRQT